MDTFINSERYARPLEAVIQQLSAQVAPEQLDSARKALTGLREDLPTPADAFDNLVGLPGLIEQIFGALENTAWREGAALSLTRHQEAIRDAMAAVKEFCEQVLSDKELGAKVFDACQASLTASGLMTRLATSFESDGKDLGESRSDRTDALMLELRTTLSSIIEPRMQLSL